jgi:hypothetical protein
MKFYGKNIQKFELYEPIELKDDGWYEWEGTWDNKDAVILDPGTYILDSIYITDKGLIGFNYTDADQVWSDSNNPEFDIQDLIRLEKDDIIKFIIGE